ncbi:hypothetical protein L2E82_19936 [Cichorium intybus]|uniref:Uncharacterized protein n=1 Tax=Cichorium intybus TaxID=13427 RepID=A0ACB9DSP3_CICIN|nr:hypothetical protein L2E82_19936 [Cichorium intybus]
MDMASSSKLRKKSKKLKPHYEMESEDDSILSNMAMDYEKEKVIAITFDSIKDSFLIDLCSEKSEFLEHEVENIDDDENLVHLDDDENDDLGLQEGGGLTIISDQHKGLLEAVKEIMPNAEHRQCARHIYANFKKKYNGEEYKNLFWAAASCTVEPEFTSVMEKLKAIDVGAYKYLMSHDKKSWCHAYFCQDRAFLDLRKSGYDEQEIEELMATTDAQEFDELRVFTLHEEEGIEETAIDEVNFVPETIIPGFEFQKIPKVRQKSERITLAKLKKKVDGPGLTQDEPMELD